MLSFRFGVHASVAPTMSAWRDQARMAEDLGYSTLYVADHLGAQFGPLVATTVAAEATSPAAVPTPEGGLIYPGGAAGDCGEPAPGEQPPRRLS